MTDRTTQTGPLEVSKGSATYKALAKRHRKEKHFKYYTIGAVLFSFTFLAILLLTVITQGLSAFLQTEMRLTVVLEETAFPEDIQTLSKEARHAQLKKIDTSAFIKTALKTTFPNVTKRRDRLALYRLVSSRAELELLKFLRSHPDAIGTAVPMWLTAATDVDMFVKGHISKEVPEHKRKLKDKQIEWIEALEDKGDVRTTFNTHFFSSGDSREPENAGILGSMIGSLLTLFVCMLVAFPLGVGAAIYLEELAVKNWFTDIIEVNINNLAAVPSIVFGLLGLAVYLNLFGFARSSSLVGGMTLALLVLPTVVIATRNALKAIPPSIRDAARGLGASPMQIVMHHTVPLAMPGIMTGTVLSIARALGETAPLLMIGMVAFISDVPRGIEDPATTLPVQIYLWADSPEMAFAEKTSAAIMVLLAFLALLNIVANIIRQRYERTW